MSNEKKTTGDLSKLLREWRKGVNQKQINKRVAAIKSAKTKK
jgi:hypothetical protein